MKPLSSAITTLGTGTPVPTGRPLGGSGSAIVPASPSLTGQDVPTVEATDRAVEAILKSSLKSLPVLRLKPTNSDDGYGFDAEPDGFDMAPSVTPAMATQ